MRVFWGLVGIVLIVGAVVAGRFWPAIEAPQPAPPPAPLEPPPAEPVPAAPSPKPLAVAEEPVAAPPIDEAPSVEEAASVEEAPAAPLPPLNDSDGFVRSQAAAFNLPSVWTADDELVRRFATLMANAGRGETPPQRLSFGALSPAEKFPVRREGERFFVDPSGYSRYDAYLDQLERLDPETLAAFIGLLAPLLEEALGELDHQGGAKDAALDAIDQALAAPALEGEIELVRPGLLFQYADPSLESLGGLQKQVLRMGPRNAQRLHSYLRRLRPLL